MASLALSLLVFVLALGPGYSGYVVTTPRRWTIGVQSQICASLNTGTFSASDSLKYKLTELYQKAVLLNETALVFPAGENFACVNVPVPYTTDRTVTIVLTGTLASEPVSDMANLTFVEGTGRTFIQTDKYLYKPGQEVQFRVLSVKDPNITVVTTSYEEIYVNNPSRTRIAQWKNVNNSAGLVHLSFDLHDEVVEGTYIIGAKFADKTSEEKIFRVEEYVLPRYEVTIDAPKNILGSDESVTVKVCAKYTFGEPVKGNATIYLAAASWKVYANLTETKPITGCENFTFPSKDLLFDHNNCHIRIHNLQAHAVVVEDGTGTELHGDNSYIQVHRRAIQFRDRSPAITQKPYLPAAIQLDAVFPDNSPASNEIMKVCTYYQDEEVCKNFTTNAQGTISFVMPSQTATRLEVKAVNYPKIERNWNDVMEESSFFKYSFSADEYVDSMNASLTVMKDKIKCNTGAMVNFSVPVIYVAKDQSTTIVHLQISSRGQVVKTQNMDVKFIESKLPIKDVDKLLPLETVPAGLVLGSFEIPVTLTEEISPKISILVWYSNEDGTVVADSSEVDVAECLSHNVNFTWSVKKAEPGQEANFIIKGANNALCSIGVVDKSVDLLSVENNKLDIQSLLQITYNSEVPKWDENQLNLEYCYRKYNYSAENLTLDDPTATENEKVSSMSAGFTIRRPYNRYSMLEAIHMFSNAGYYVFSNLVLEKKFCDDLIIEDMKNKASALNPEIADQDSVSGHRLPAAYAPQALGFGGGFGGGSEEKILVDAGPSLAGAPAPAPANKEGEVEATQERSYLPETWLWLLKPLSATGELTEAVELPDTITEWIGNTVCVHPSEGVGIASSSITTFTPFFVDLTLPSTATRGEILPIKISIFNYLTEDLPVKVVVEESKDYSFVDGDTGTREICVSSKHKTVEIIKVNLTSIGDINITVEASSQPITSVSCGSGTPTTKKDRLIRSLPVDPEGYLREKTFTEYFCSQDVENSEGLSDFWVTKLPSATSEGSARSWITVIGDLMGPTVENIGNLVRFPSGCGEQNMINFAPNIYILQYLETTNQTTPLLKDKITKYLNQGYQRQLLFKHEADNSYSTFGENDAEGSTWLTAFVVKSFAQAKPYTLIDQTSLRKSAEWLKNLQNKEGCFESKGRVINKMLQGGITGNDDSEGLLTAYVLAAILEEGNVTEEMKLSAVKCIEANASTHPYSLALKSYSLALANSSNNTKATIDKLMATSVSNTSMLRWELPDREGQNTALHVETAAYALLALVTYDYNAYKEQTRKIVRWISSNRNGQGGFVSTQDTVVALQALAAFEKVQPKEPLNMEISVSSSKINHSFKVTEENKFLQQLIDVPTPSVNVTLTVGGTGCALIQGVLRYNVLSDSKSEVLTLKVNSSEGKDCKTQNITACATYTLPDGASNMAIMEFRLVTGYIPIKQDLKDVVGDGKGTFKRYEVDGPKVTFYLEELTATETCANIRVYQEVEIENAKPGSVTVYDYYQPEYTIAKKYNLTSTCKPGT